MTTAIRLNRVSLKYMTEKGEVHAVNSVDLAIEQGEFVGIVGPSGSGKSTLLSLIAGLLLPTSGRVEVFGQEVRGPSSQSAYMLQQDCLLEWRTIEGNALLGLEIMGRVSAEKRLTTVTLLNEYGLEEFRHLYPRQLSGGMRQRVALVRTLATEPAICLLDEPFSALDYTSRLTLQNDVSTILRKSGKTCVLVTHDIPEAIAMCDRVIVLTNRPGRVKWNLPIELSAGEKQPLLRRRAPEFGKYFNRIWEEMELSVATEKTS
ncbi:MAG: NitT/TauT family transport system ATP-binding protein [Bacillota bacterium]|nr:MAG: NitT/TauT family transport system ATP-binding protein [Bacillota bacterium]